MAKTTVRFDGHCHFFNIWFLIEELAAIAWDVFRGTYPRGMKTGLRSIQPIPTGVGAKLKPGSIIDLIERLIRQIVQVGSVMTGSYSDNYHLLKRDFAAVRGQGETLAAVPLMMDIYFMFEWMVTKGLLKSGIPPTDTPRDPEAEFHEWFSEIKNLIHQEIPEYIGVQSSGPNISASPEYPTIQERLDRIGREIALPQLLGASQGERAMAMTPGFRHEIEACIKFQSQYKGMVFPFLAVDPRRRGIMDLIKNGNAFGIKGPLVSKNGPFFGIKLYPRLGYVPRDLEEIGLFEWCQKTDSPIILHCSRGGFPPVIEPWGPDDNGDPELWRDILTKYRGLRVDFAHFGGPKNEKWQSTIEGFISEPGTFGDRIYTDISCFTDLERLRKTRTIYDANAALKNKLMFGTDFDVMLLTGFMDNQEYFNQFFEVFSNTAEHNYTESLMNTAPRSFLSLDR